MSIKRFQKDNGLVPDGIVGAKTLNKFKSIFKLNNVQTAHFFGQIATILFVFYIFNNSFWILLPITPFVVYPFAWAGHFFFEKNKPAAFSNPFWAKACDWLMFRDIILRRIKL